MSDLSDASGEERAAYFMEEPPPARRKRTSLEVTADVLDAAMEGARKTTIMYRANLSYNLLNRYLEKLVSSELLLERDAFGKFRVSPRGQKFLKEFRSYKKSKSTYLKRERTVNGFFG